MTASPSTEPTLSTLLADFTLDLRLDALPPEIVQKAKTHLLDGLGNALASSGFEYAEPVLRGATALGRGSDAHCLATGTALPPAGAALVNGTLIHGLDFDDTHIGAIYHATAPALASSLAAAEAAGADGRTFLEAFIVGLEIGCRLARAAEGGFHDRGWHPTALCGAFASVFAAGRLMGASRDQIVSATGLCGSMAAGVLELENSWLKRMHPGWAAHSGIAALSLAMSGFKGPPTMLEGRRGFYRTHLGTTPAGPISPSHRLGDDWLIAGIAFKPYPCCHFIHGFVDCALHLRGQVDLYDIDSIDCPLSARLQHMVSGPARPAEPYAAMFSVPYVVALALQTGEVDLAAFHDKGVGDPRVLALADRTTCSDDPASDFPVHFPGEVRITLKTGEVVSHRVRTSLGTPECPLDAGDVERKFVVNATRVMRAGAAEKVVGLARSVERIGRISELIGSCTI